MYPVIMYQVWTQPKVLSTQMQQGRMTYSTFYSLRCDGVIITSKVVNCSSLLPIFLENYTWYHTVLELQLDGRHKKITVMPLIHVYKTCTGSVDICMYYTDVFTFCLARGV